MLSMLTERARARQHDGALDSGDVVQTVVLIAGFVMVAIVLIVWVGTASLNKGADTASCVEYGTGNYDSGKDHRQWMDPVCGNSAAGHSKDSTIGWGGIGKGGSFKKDQSYTNRY